MEVRRRLGLKEGDRVQFVLEEGRTVLRPLRSEVNPFEAYLGALPAFQSRKEINRLLADFVIGAHALLQADRFLTLDAGAYEQDFPDIALL